MLSGFLNFPAQACLGAQEEEGPEPREWIRGLWTVSTHGMPDRRSGNPLPKLAWEQEKKGLSHVSGSRACGLFPPMGCPIAGQQSPAQACLGAGKEGPEPREWIRGLWTVSTHGMPDRRSGNPLPKLVWEQEKKGLSHVSGSMEW